MQGIEWEPLKFGTELRFAGTGFFGSREALGRVGAIAWMKIKNRGANHHWAAASDSGAVKIPAIDWFKSLRSLAAADEQVRAPKQLEIYEQISAAQQQQNRLLEETTLKIAELHLGWFDYPQAAATL